jgi:hypothetical protein
MALSQYVAINFLTKFDKKGLERATKELKGFDKTIATGSFRLKAFAKAGGVAAAAGLAIFAKRSIDAALAQEKLDKQLQLSLRSIGEEFAINNVKTFINTDTILPKNISGYTLSKYQFYEWLEKFSEKITCINIKIEHYKDLTEDNKSRFLKINTEL